MNDRAVIVRTYMGNLLVITSYMVNDYLSNQTLMPGSQYVVNLHILTQEVSRSHASQ